MKTWEFDVELRVRKTFTFGGPLNEQAAREIMASILSGGLPLLTMSKWEPDTSGYGRHPVETIIDNDPVIVAVREIPP